MAVLIDWKRKMAQLAGVDVVMADRIHVGVFEIE